MQPEGSSDLSRQCTRPSQKLRFSMHCPLRQGSWLGPHSEKVKGKLKKIAITSKRIELPMLCWYSIREKHIPGLD